LFVNPRSLLADAGAITLYAIVIGALVHLATILAVPSFATRDAFARLAPLGPVNATIALERPGPRNRQLPYGDPAVASAFCRFDLTGGPVRVKARIVRSGFASLSFHTRPGSVFYALTDKAAVRGRLEALVLTAAQLRSVAARDNEDEPSQELRIVSSTDQGFVLIRAFSEQPSLYPQSESDARSLVCASEPLPK
jgi:uncharacterized membrane protein